MSGGQPLASGSLWRALTRRGRLFLIAGPCVIENPRHPHAVAARVKKIAEEVGIPYVFKASYDKANRSSQNTYRGPGLELGLEILASVRERHQVPILTDVHDVSQVEKVALVWAFEGRCHGELEGCSGTKGGAA